MNATDHEPWADLEPETFAPSSACRIVALTAVASTLWVREAAVAGPVQALATTAITAADVRNTPLRLALGAPLVLLSDDSLEFGRVGSACFLPTGDAVALSTAPPKLLAIRLNERPGIDIIGKRGNGPGEFQQPWAVSCFDHDSVAVLEPFRISQGELRRPPLQTRAINSSGNSSWLEPVARLSGGRFLMRRRPREMAGGVTGTFRERVDVVLNDPLRRAGIETPLLVHAPGSELVRAAVSGGRVTAVHPIGRSLLLAAVDDDIYAMDTGTNQLLKVPVNGGTIRRVQFEFEGREVTRALADRYQERQRVAAKTAAQRQTAEALWTLTVLPKRAPLFDRMTAVRGGGVWLREYVLEGEATARWLRLDGSLAPRWRWRLPSTVRILAATRDRVLSVDVRDDETLLRVDMVEGEGR